MNLIQLQHSAHGRRVGLIKEPAVVLLHPSVTSTYELFKQFVDLDNDVQQVVTQLVTGETLAYDPVYHGQSEWRLLPPIDCSEDPMQCVIAGTGLTHKASAANRHKMHESQKVQSLTDSMKMYLMGEEGGKPPEGKIGVQPEWFYKGNGSNLKGHAQPLVVPNFADDGGDEPEIAGIYIISSLGFPTRLGFVQGNEFSDHVMEKKNYLYLAPSKIRNCAIGPELVVNMNFDSIHGDVKIVRQGVTGWSHRIHTGEDAMAHSLANLEHHHFKYEQHRIPGQLHVHFFGASAFSFGEQIQLENGDEMHISFENMGRPLVNPIAINDREERLVKVRTLK
jgi:hypothetical protein